MRVEAWLTWYRLQQYGVSESFGPDVTWKASYFTSSQKMQKLYDLTKLIVQPPIESNEKDRSVCITYGGWTNSTIHEATAWYTRDPQAQPQKPPEVTQAVKRSQESPKDATKRRKVRLGKQMDVGSLLGAFR
jgi:hypothetical protein